MSPKTHIILFYLHHNPNKSPKQPAEKINIYSSVDISLKFFNICNFNSIKIHHINFKIPHKGHNTQYKKIFFISSFIKNVNMIVSLFAQHHLHHLTNNLTHISTSLYHFFKFIFCYNIIRFYLIC